MHCSYGVFMKETKILASMKIEYNYSHINPTNSHFSEILCNVHFSRMLVGVVSVRTDEKGGECERHGCQEECPQEHWRTELLREVPEI